MSGVYFANTKPILTCGDCPFNEWNPGAEENCGFCSRIGRPVWDDEEPDAECGIVNVPDHGRLGDLDALADKCDDPHWCVWLSDIEDAPTVIPADKEAEA